MPAFKKTDPEVLNNIQVFSQHEKTSQLLVRAISSITLVNDHKVALEDVISTFQRRSYAGLFFILALLSFLPGISILAGAVMILPSLQLLFGKKSPVLPTQLGQIMIPTKRVNRGFYWLLPKLRRIETRVKPRLLLLTYDFSQQLIGLVAFILAVIIAVPFPLSNLLPAISMLFISVGLLEKDGIYIGIGLAISLVAIVLSVMIVKAIYFSIEHLLLT